MQPERDRILTRLMIAADRLTDGDLETLTRCAESMAAMREEFEKAPKEAGSLQLVLDLEPEI